MKRAKIYDFIFETRSNLHLFDLMLALQKAGVTEIQTSREMEERRSDEVKVSGNVYLYL